MRLASVEVIPYALPFKRPYVTARGTLTQREMVLLRLRSDEGVVGLGEAVPLSLRGGVTIETVVGELEALGASDLLRELVSSADVDASYRIEAEPRLSAPTRCAAETALLDLREKQEVAGPAIDEGLPDGRPRIAYSRDKGPDRPVPCNATLVAGPPAAVAADARHWADDGFTTFKLKLGAGEDVAQVKAVREALGADAKIRIDANGIWALEEAKRLLAEIEPIGIELVEQPVETIEEAAELSRATSIPLAGDESIVSQVDAKNAVESGGFQATGIKLSKVGGALPAVRIAHLMPSYVASALDGPVGIAAGRRMAEWLDWENAHPEFPHFAHGLATQRLFASTIAAVECELRGQMLHESGKPGLGVEIDEDALRAHRL